MQIYLINLEPQKNQIDYFNKHIAHKESLKPIDPKDIPQLGYEFDLEAKNLKAVNSDIVADRCIKAICQWHSVGLINHSIGRLLIMMIQIEDYLIENN